MPEEHDSEPVASEALPPVEDDDIARGESGSAKVAQMLREAAAVLAAILVAFALDAWWDARVERASMLDALDAVGVEIERNIALVDSAVAWNSGQVENGWDAARLDRDDLAAVSEEDVVRYQNPGFQIVTLERGAITAFIRGDFLQAVDDVELRTTIAATSTLQDELDEEREGLVAADDRLTAVTFSTLASHEHLFRAAIDDSGPVRMFLEVLVEDDQLQGATAARALTLGLYTAELRRVRERLSAAHDVILEVDR